MDKISTKPYADHRYISQALKSKSKEQGVD